MADSILENKEVLQFLLGLLVKKNGGVIKIPEQDIVSVSGADMITLAYDKKTQMVILMTINANDISPDGRN